jgi:hypothetical protein
MVRLPFGKSLSADQRELLSTSKGEWEKIAARYVEAWRTFWQAPPAGERLMEGRTAPLVVADDEAIRPAVSDLLSELIALQTLLGAHEPHSFFPRGDRKRFEELRERTREDIERLQQPEIWLWFLGEMTDVGVNPLDRSWKPRNISWPPSPA